MNTNGHFFIFSCLLRKIVVNISNRRDADLLYWKKKGHLKLDLLSGCICHWAVYIMSWIQNANLLLMEHIIQRYTHSHTHANPFQLTSAEVRMIRKINPFMWNERKGFSALVLWMKVYWIVAWRGNWMSFFFWTNSRLFHFLIRFLFVTCKSIKERDF